jgi:hypothetical protein
MLRVALMAALVVTPVAIARAQWGSGAQTESADSIPQANLVQPEALNQMLRTERAHPPVVLQVGSRAMFDQAHIRDAIYAGPGSQPGGRELLRSRVDRLPRTAEIVIYCGCCPWQRCPNLGPAFAELEQMGFKNVKVLYLANNFGTDWVAKGYPVRQGD